jgi:hypothetical protein
MALDFPSSPSVNDTYSSGGVTYTWDGTVWVSSGPVGFVQKAGDTMTGPLVVEGDVQMASLNGNQLAGFRNKLINGAMQVAQRGTSITGTSAALTECRTCDRMVFALNLLGTWDITQNTASPDGFSSSFGLSCSAGQASPTAAAFLILVQRLEGQDLQDLQYGTPGAKAVTLSFWVKSNVTGTASLAFRQMDPDRMYSTTYTINAADTWEYKTITVPGDTAGQIDNDNNNSYQLEWWLNSGSTFTGGTTQGWGAFNNANRNPSVLGIGGSTNDNFFITGLQLEPGPVASPFEHRPIGTELALCQRYFFRTSSRYFASKNATNSSPGTDAEGFVNVILPTTMRASPTVDASTISLNSATSATVKRTEPDIIVISMTSTTTSSSNTCGLNEGLFVSAEL